MFVGEYVNDNLNPVAFAPRSVAGTVFTACGVAYRYHRKRRGAAKGYTRNRCRHCCITAGIVTTRSLLALAAPMPKDEGHHSHRSTAPFNCTGT